MNQDAFRVSEQAASLSAWRRRYESTADAPTWLASHQWKFGPEVAIAAAEEIRKKLMLQPGHSLIEVGAGTGAFLAKVLFDEQRGVALDFCGAMIRRGHGDASLRKRMDFLVAEAAALPIPESSFDRVLCYSVAQYFPSTNYARTAIREMLRVCRPGGIVLIGDVWGILERPLRLLRKLRSPEFLIQAILSVLTPIHNVRSEAKRPDGLDFRRYSRCFFECMFEKRKFTIEVLEQNIPARAASNTRFDVRICKKPHPVASP